MQKLIPTALFNDCVVEHRDRPRSCRFTTLLELTTRSPSTHLKMGIGIVFWICVIFFLPTYGFAEDMPHRTLESLEKDLNLVRSLEANFVQKNSDGTVFKGKLFLDRPGKLKFDYDTPKGMIIVSEGNNLIYFDPSSHQATYLALESSPASLLLDGYLDFRKHATLVSFYETQDRIEVSLRTHKTSHTITLFINPKDKMLQGWKTKDPQGNEVELSFSHIKKNPDFCDKTLFLFKKPKRFKKG
jgi:outer membrane lipoprotein-sorting protein